ncbi:MAG: 16S rRNA (cytidine(1402)-2'-O)-methyltransferase, partial [Proteobacteria bacterium]|nr:16S rRNA (cytidine(1402)-2'-O)-methyltransferase [Pseudomonadota bacterium]
MSTGTLYIVSTPIGNLEDITMRALRILAEVDLIAAEDTRKTSILLNHYTIKKPLTSYFEHNEQVKTGWLISELQAGKNIALVSEAGTPTISDPGFRIVAAAIAAEITVVPVPGPCAAIGALSTSGLAVHRFAFEGFLPPKSGKRKNLLKKIAGEERTLIFYESPYRIQAAIADMLAVLGDRRAVVARELTKIHEEFIYGTLSSIAERLGSAVIKGEF